MAAASPRRRAEMASATFTASSEPTRRTLRPPTPEAKLYRKGKGKEAKLCFMGHVLMENRHGLIVDGRLGEANGTAERDQAEAMVAAIPGRHRITVGGDKNFDTAGFVAALKGA
jgi:hypothetical protein